MKSGYAALVGRPNVGKSTLMNRLIGQKIAIISDRPQTTRDKIETVYTDERGQIIFMDTPGIHKAKNKLGEYMDLVAEKTFSDADVILWLVEPTTYIGAGEEHIAEMLRAVDRKKHPVLLVINKTDTLDDPDEIENVIKAYREKCEYEEIICVSAVTGKNEEELLDTLFRYMPEGPLYYDEETVTEIPMRSIAEELIREQMLKHIKEEIPHGTAVQINRFKERKDGIFDIDADIVCERDSHKGIIIGKNGNKLKGVGKAARKDIEQLTGGKVYLSLWVKVKENWRDSERTIRSWGYRDEH